MDKTMLKGLAVLEAMATHDGPPRTIHDLAVETGLTRSNVHRTLQTLAHAGYVRPDPKSGKYVSTLKLFELGARQIQRLDVRALAQPAMSELADLTLESIHLAILEGSEVLYIDKLEGVQAIRAYTTIGGRAPAYCVATGKAMLAAQADLSLKPSDLKRWTSSTLTSLKALSADLAETRRRGYAVNRGEWREGVGGVAAVIVNGWNEPAAAIGVSGPIERLDDKRIQKIAPQVQKAALLISRALGSNVVTAGVGVRSA